MKNLRKIAAALAAAALLYACQNNGATSKSDGFAKGADVGWLTEMEAAGKKFYTAQGQEMELMALLKELGMNSIRLRVWVNPVEHGNWCNKADLLVKARRAHALGMRIMVNFHYSDWWADPSKQNKPAAWKSYSVDELKAAVAAHTTEVLSALKQENIAPEWVQVGNETDNGLLWETGKADANMKNYAAFVQAGYNAAKAVFPDTKVVVHVSNGYKNSLFRWNYDGLKANGAKWDAIGMSLYPSYAMGEEGSSYKSWQEVNDDCIANAKDMIQRHGTEVIICEVGMPNSQAAACRDFITDLIAKAKAVPDNMVTGVFYWEPECYNWMDYGLGAFDSSGKPTVAMDAFK